MKKSNLLARLEQLRLQNEEDILPDCMPYILLDLLLEYINDPQLRQVIDEIPL